MQLRAAYCASEGVKCLTDACICCCWVLGITFNVKVHIFEGSKAAITLPAKELIETDEVWINSAALVNIRSTQSDVEVAED